MDLDTLAHGLVAGSLYALVAVSFNILYRPSNVFNFAQGELVMLGAMLFASATSLAGLPWIAPAVLHRLMQDRPADLRGQRVVQPVDKVADVVRDVAKMQAVAAAIARIENFLQVFGGSDNRLVVWQRAVAQVADAANLGVGIDDPLRQDRQVFFKSNVGGHGG